MERDDEVSGAGNSYTTEFRQYDPRLGRWMSIDPLFRNFPWQSPYVAFDNNPILKNDPRGDAPGDGDGGKERAEKAKEIDQKDTRAYDRNGQRKPGDNLVDCSEFAAEVQSSTGYTNGGMKASVQADKFKKTGEWSSNLADVQLGDQVFFTKGNGINHTAIVTDVDADGNVYITHATVNKGRPGSIKTEKLNPDGSIPYWNNSFVGTGRPALSQSTASETQAASGNAQASATTNSNPTTANQASVQYPGTDRNQTIIYASPDQKVSDYLKESKAPIVRDIGEILDYFGF